MMSPCVGKSICTGVFANGVWVSLFSAGRCVYVLEYKSSRSSEGGR